MRYIRVRQAMGAVGLALAAFAWAGCGDGSSRPDGGGETPDDGSAGEIDAPDGGPDDVGDVPDGDGGTDVEVADAGDGEAEAMPACTADGEECGSAPFCCPGTVCAAGFCRPAPARVGEPCSPDRPCDWLAGACDGGICTCSGAGGACATDEECCPYEGPCVGGTCAGDCTVWGGAEAACTEVPCCGRAGLTECDYTCSWPDDWRETLAPGCRDLVWDGTGSRLPACSDDAQCCPWLGPCTAGLCGACLLAGASCTRGIDCCGLACDGGGTCAGASCRHRGEACAADAECCTRPCSAGRCGCLPPGAACARAEECCAGPCAGGVCGDGCPETCTGHGDCCADHECVADRCMPTGPMIIPYRCRVDAECTGPYYGDGSRCDRGVYQLRCSVSDGTYYAPGWRPRCATDSDCCPSKYCDLASGTCRDDCGGEGASCRGSTECCEGATVGGTHCDDGVCTRCRAGGIPCDDWTQCCSWFCSGGFCASPCASIGDACLSTADCCDAGVLCTGTPPAPLTCCFPDGHACTRPEECCGLCDGTTCISRPPGP